MNIGHSTPILGWREPTQCQINQNAGTDMAKILLVEDETDIAEVIAFNLRGAGHDVIAVGNGAQAIAATKTNSLDLVLLDLMLPDMSGLEICRGLKADDITKDVPVVMVTAKGEEIDRVVGFELGVDDYVVKPFSPRELVLRIAAVLRRRGNTTDGPNGAGQQGTNAIRFGNLTVDRDAHKIWVGGAEIALTALEFRLLVTLYERRNRFSRDQSCWKTSGQPATKWRPVPLTPTSNGCAKNWATRVDTSRPYAGWATGSWAHPRSNEPLIRSGPNAQGLVDPGGSCRDVRRP